MRCSARTQVNTRVNACYCSELRTKLISLSPRFTSVHTWNHLRNHLWSLQKAAWYSMLFDTFVTCDNSRLEVKKACFRMRFTCFCVYREWNVVNWFFFYVWWPGHWYRNRLNFSLNFRHRLFFQHNFIHFLRVGWVRIYSTLYCISFK